MQYDGLAGNYTLQPTTYSLPGTGGWKSVRWNVSDGFFGNRQNGPSDFRLVISAGQTLAIRRVSVFLPEEQSGTGANAPAVDVANGSMSWPDTADATGWRLYSSDSLLSNNWQKVTGPLTFTNGVIRQDTLPTNPAAFYRLQRPARQ